MGRRRKGSTRSQRAVTRSQRAREASLANETTNDPDAPSASTPVQQNLVVPTTSADEFSSITSVPPQERTQVAEPAAAAAQEDRLFSVTDSQ